MKDLQLYQQILGLVVPWQVESVALKPKEREIEVRVTFAETLWACPQCQKRMEVHDYEERRWRHLDSCQFKTVLVSRVCAPVIGAAVSFMLFHSGWPARIFFTPTANPRDLLPPAALLKRSSRAR